MARHIHRTVDLTILNGAQLSNVISGNDGKIAFGGSYAISFFGPAALTGTVTVQVAPVNTPSAGDWVNLSAGGSDVTVAALKCIIVANPSFLALRLSSASVELADRVFRLLVMVEAV